MPPLIQKVCVCVCVIILPENCGIVFIITFFPMLVHSWNISGDSQKDTLMASSRLNTTVNKGWTDRKLT